MFSCVGGGGGVCSSLWLVVGAVSELSIFSKKKKKNEQKKKIFLTSMMVHKFRYFGGMIKGMFLTLVRRRRRSRENKLYSLVFVCDRVF